MADKLKSLEKKLGHEFSDLKLLHRALVHKSFGNENFPSADLDERNNERLEFLGDAVLDLVISEELLKAFPEAPEGELSRMRASLVNERVLAKLARELDLGKYLELGKGEEMTGGREKDSILSSALEAVVAALFRDGGFEAAAKCLQRAFGSRIQKPEMEFSLADYKTRLQEISQAKHKSAPVYNIVTTSGPDHERTFEVEVRINDRPSGRGTGRNRKEAEQAAARAALENLEK